MPNWPENIKHVALCGNPKSGKTTLAEMLAKKFGGVIVDDGMILRQAVPILFGVDPSDPFTQAGKAKVYLAGDVEEEVRIMMGELGKYLEGRYGEHFLPKRAMQIAESEHPDAPFYIYPSCRKVQGGAYKAAGGVVLEIDNPSVGPSGNDFDVWDKQYVDLSIHNDPALGGLDMLEYIADGIPDQVEKLVAG